MLKTRRVDDNGVRLPVQLRRDSFARQTLMRAIMRHGSCQWCGEKPQTLYLYYWEDDNYNRNIDKHSGPFCSIGCWEMYNA